MVNAIPFLILCLIHLAGETLNSQKVRYVTKPLLMPALAGYYLANATPLSWAMLMAIFGGWLGDIFLMLPDKREGKLFFKLGLVSFLIGHLFYAWAFLGWGDLQFSLGKGWAILFFLIYGGVVFVELKPHMGALFIPITLYIVVIVLMGISVSLCMGVQPAGLVATALAGALIFMVSDTLNAWNRFAGAIPYERILVMFTYLLGQFLLVFAALGFV